MTTVHVGTDEAGKGPVLGSMFAAAVRVDPGALPDGVADSKKLGASRRETLAEAIRDRATATAVVEVPVERIDDPDTDMNGLTVTAHADALAAVSGNGSSDQTDPPPTDADGPAVTVTGLSERRYPYLTEALASGQSEPYRTGPIGLKEAFAHSPFDERDGLLVREPDARHDGGVVVVADGERYLVAVSRT